MTTQEIESMPNGTKLQRITGTVSKVWPPSDQTPGQRKYGIHNQGVMLTLSDGKEIRLKLQNPAHHLDSSAEGRRYEVVAGGGPGDPKDLEVNVFNGTTSIQVGRSAIPSFLGTDTAAPPPQATAPAAAAAPAQSSASPEWPTVQQLAECYAYIYGAVEKAMVDYDVNLETLSCTAGRIWQALPVHLRFVGSPVMPFLKGAVSAGPPQAAPDASREVPVREAAHALVTLRTAEAAATFKRSLYPELGLDRAYEIFCEALRNSAPERFEASMKEAEDLAAAALTAQGKTVNTADIKRQLLSDPLTVTGIFEANDDLSDVPF